MSCRVTRVMAVATIRASIMIAADTSNPRENPAASAWPEMLTWADPAACAAFLAVFTTTVEATVPRIASPIEAPTTWPVLIRLEARPASASCTLDREVKVSGVNSRPRPAPVSSVGPSRPPV